VDDLTFKPFVMLLYKEIRRFGKVVIQTVVTPLITSSLYLLIFGVSLGKNIHMANGVSYLAFIIPGLMMMSVLNNAYQNSSTTVVSGKFSGDLVDLKVAPLSFHQIIWALALGGLIRGTIVGSITLGVGELFHHSMLGHYMPIENPAKLAIFIFLGGISFAMMGISVAFWAKSFDQLSAVSSFILTPLIYLGGVFFSLDGLHPFWRMISRYNPLLYLINGVRYGVLGISDVSFPAALMFASGTVVVFYFTAFYSLRRASFSRW